MILKDFLKQLLNELEKTSSLELAKSRNKAQEIIIKTFGKESPEHDKFKAITDSSLKEDIENCLAEIIEKMSMRKAHRLVNDELKSLLDNFK